MTNKLDQLNTDIRRLETSITLIESKLTDIDCGKLKTADPALVATLIESKDRAVTLLNQKQSELDREKENSRVKTFGSIKMKADDIARLSIGGSLKTSSLDKTSVNDETKKKLIDDIFKNEPDEKKRADSLLQKGFIVQRKV